MGTRIRRATLAPVLFLLMLPFSAASAGSFHAVINGKSFHLDASQDWNENNSGFGIEYEFDTRSRWKKRAMVNGFRDSNGAPSYMLGGGLYRNLYASDRLAGFYVDAGFNLFLMTREDVNDNRPFPGAVPSLTIGNRHVGMNVVYIPKVAVEKFLNMSASDPTVDGLIFAQFKISFDALLP